MQTKEKKNVIFVRLFPDEDINEQLKKACEFHDVKTAVVISGIGQLKNVQLGYFKGKGDYAPETFDGAFELLSLNGNICRQDGEYILHLHVVLGNERKSSIGGHLISSTVEITNEIVLLKTNLGFKRELDEKTGLKAMTLA